jgi:phage baseplate assembly protein W
MATYIGYSSIGSISGSKVLVDKDLALRDLLNHFYTRKGERVMNPEFGSIIWDLVFDPLDEITENAAKNDVKRIIDSDPRWIFEDMQVTKPQEHALKIAVRVYYNDTGTAEELYLDFIGEIE